jgi:hypothetical protein
LIDVTTLNANFADGWHYQQVDVRPVFTTANGGRARALGCVHLEVFLCGAFRSLFFWVLKSVPNGMLIGFSALKKLRARIDCGTNELWIDDCVQEFHSEGLTMASVPQRAEVGAFLKKDVMVEPMSWELVNVSSGQHYPQEGTFSVFVSDTPFAQKAMIAKGPTYVKERQLKVLVFNFDDAPLFLRRGQRVAKLLPYSDDEYFHSIFDVYASGDNLNSAAASSVERDICAVDPSFFEER